MDSTSKREELIKQYREMGKKIKLEPDPQKQEELAKEASKIHEQILIEEFGGDKNIGRFNKW